MKGVPVRSLHARRQARHWNIRYPRVVRRAISVVVGAAQEGHGTVFLLTQLSWYTVRIPQPRLPPLPTY